MPVPAFPLDTAGWLPVLWTPPATATATSAGGGGSLPGRVGLRTVLERSHEISALAIAEPPAYAAVLRVLYALTARVCGLDVDDDSSGRDWSERRLDILDAGRLPADGIDAYFSSWAGRFDLFDPGRPWMQDPRLAEQCDPARSAGVNKLTPTRASGNNHAWFSKVQDTDPDPVPAGEAALSLLTWHYWGPSGRGSAREAGGERTASMMAGPLRGALSYHPEGETLFESLLAGLLRPDPRVRREEDACMWEWDALPDPTAAPAAPTGPCSRLTAVSQHALLLVPDPHDPGLVGDAFITWAYRERLPRNDPYLIWQMSQQGNAYPRPADAGRALWRDIDALLLTQPGGTAQVHRPEVFATAVEISDATPRPLAVRALGFDQDGQAKDRQFVTGLTPPVLDSVEEENPATAPAVGWLRRCGEMYGRRAEYAARRACALYMRENKPKEAEAWAAQAAALYWPRAEEEFWSRFARLDRTGAPVAEAGLDRQAATAFLNLAQHAYETVTEPVAHTQRGARAIADARIELYGGRRTPTR